MFRSFASRVFNPRKMAFVGTFFLFNSASYWLMNDEDNQFNQKLKKKLN